MAGRQPRGAPLGCINPRVLKAGRIGHTGLFSLAAQGAGLF